MSILNSYKTGREKWTIITPGSGISEKITT